MGIKINENQNIFSIETKNTSYIFGVDNLGLIRHLYWGNRIDNINDFQMPVLNEVSTNDPVHEITPEEFPVHGGLRYKETCLKVNFSDKTREIVLRYEGYEINGQELIIKLKDNHYYFDVNLHYRSHYDYDLMERWVEIVNNTKDQVLVEKIHSAQFHIPYEGLNFSNTRGHWGAEQQRFTQKMSFGKVVIENRRGISTHNHNPHFILDKDATESTGEVYFGALKLSGNFKGVVEQTQYGETLVQMGINEFDFELSLEAGKSFIAPAIICGYTSRGFERMSHNLHKFANDNILRSGLRPVLYNSWEATEFKVTCNEQIKLAKKAKEIGAELFVVDDGWFGERDCIYNGLGDWYVNEEKFPNGLKPLIDEVKGLDMKFGIWVEPEMVSVNSRLYEAHPEWVIEIPDVEHSEGRNQRILDLTYEAVQDYIIEKMSEVFSSADISYVKWDMNRIFSDYYSKNLPPDRQKEVSHRYVCGLYRCMKELTNRFPDILFEGCAAGGNRFDLGMLCYFPQIWASDNTDALCRAQIQYNYSYGYPLSCISAHVSASPNHQTLRNMPLESRFAVAAFGLLVICVI